MIRILYILLYPISILYGISTFIRNKFYDWSLFKSTEFNTPVIVVGNLNVGGVGKTPHIEYLIRLLNQYKLATLSRGYKRQTSGFILADNISTASTIGDEPKQIQNKFSKVIVAVDEKRVNGIKQLKSLFPEIQVILLDDAYQHRAVKPGINILITDYSKLYINDTILPSGRLREWAIGSNRADIIIVSKTPTVISPIDIRRIKEDLQPKPYQEVFFSYTKYGSLTPFADTCKNLVFSPSDINSVLLITGIAKPDSLYYYIKDNYQTVEHLRYSDHYLFQKEDIATIKNSFNDLYGNNKVIITTEKDIMRLSLPEIYNEIKELPIFYIPIEICFHGNDKEEFDNKILKYVTANSRH
ncbi:MAG: tetraacyldisaccharide 4'-kinase [Flavobacteriales bacterium]|nr:tetraacyldisaccharide 4'-kinase [Flavobacteriales bacterium]MCB9363967.1 tetraacyldisaccharide 4'-kinase [Flavobacteriales bacterium]